jgi:hypothetical protein
MKRDFPYTLLSHTADLGMRVKAIHVKGFSECRMALTDIMILNKAPEPGEKKIYP